MKIRIAGHLSVYFQEMLSIADCISANEAIVQHKCLQVLPSSLVPVIILDKKPPTPTQLDKLVDELVPLLNRNTTAFTIKHKQIMSHSEII